MQFYIATQNSHKLRELTQLFSSLAIAAEVLPPPAEASEVAETGATFADNARLKSQALKALVPKDAWVLADDSGLEVDALGGAPGVRSARYAGEGCSDSSNTEKLLKELTSVSFANRTARFVCCLSLETPHGQHRFFHGTCEGHITTEISGSQGFGYDPVFQPIGYSASFGTLDPSIKNQLSHRAKALQALGSWLREST